MKAIIFSLLISMAALGAKAQTRVVVRTPCKKVTLLHSFRPVPIIMVKPVTRVAVVRTAALRPLPLARRTVVLVSRF